jgi:ferredoxin, 2Fe-2S
MPRIFVTDINGTEHEIEGEAGLKLMEVLREYEFGVIASCGGMCSCATCHVYVDAEWLGKLPEMQSDELDLVSMLATYKPKTSRLSCQVTFTEQLDGIRLTVAPEE